MCVCIIYIIRILYSFLSVCLYLRTKRYLANGKSDGLALRIGQWSRVRANIIGVTIHCADSSIFARTEWVAIAVFFLNTQDNQRDWFCASPEVSFLCSWTAPTLCDHRRKSDNPLGRKMPERFKVTKTAETEIDYTGSRDEETALGQLLPRLNSPDGESYLLLFTV